MISVKTVAAAVLGVACAVLVLGVVSGGLATIVAPAQMNGAAVPSGVYSNSSQSGLPEQIFSNESAAPSAATYGALGFKSSWPTIALLSVSGVALGLVSMFVISKRVEQNKEEGLEAEKN